MKFPDPESFLVPEGHYTFKISKEPSINRTNNRIWIIFYFKVTNEYGETRDFSDVIFPSEPRYIDLLFALGAKPDEKGTPHLHDIDPIGLTFEADIIHGPDRKDPTKTRDSVTNIVVSNDVPPTTGEDTDVPF